MFGAITFVTLLLKFSQQACYDYITEQQKIFSPHGRVRKNQFANAVVLSSNYLIVGSKYDSEIGLNAGAAHVYRDTDGKWIYYTKLIPSSGRTYGECGTTLASDGNTLVMGCPRDDVNGASSGSVYIFKLDNSSRTWVETQALKPLDGKPYAFFGRSIDIHQNTIVVNSNTDTLSVAYVYELKSDKWKLTKKLEYSSNTLDEVYYSNEVAIHGSHVVVGRWHDNLNGHQSGAAIVFQKIGENWRLDGELRPHDGSHSDWFGISAAIGNSVVVVGSHGDDVKEADGSGSAYIFRKMNGKTFMLGFVNISDKNC